MSINLFFRLLIISSLLFFIFGSPKLIFWLEFNPRKIIFCELFEDGKSSAKKYELGKTDRKVFISEINKDCLFLFRFPIKLAIKIPSEESFFFANKKNSFVVKCTGTEYKE